MKNDKKIILPIVCIVCFLILIIVIFDSRNLINSTSSNINNTSVIETLEHKLAIINKNGYVPQSDITVIRFRYLLEILEDKTTNSKQEIADMSVAGITLLRERYGREISLLQFMEGVNLSIPDGEKMNYAIAATAYLQLLK